MQVGHGPVGETLAVFVGLAHQCRQANSWSDRPGFARIRGGIRDPQAGGASLTSLLHVVFVRKAVPASNSHVHLSWQAVSAKKSDFNNLWHNCPTGKKMKKTRRKDEKNLKR